MKTIVFLIGAICFFLLFISVMLVAVFLERRRANKPQVFIAPKNVPKTQGFVPMGSVNVLTEEKGKCESTSLRKIEISHFDKKLYNFQIAEIINFYMVKKPIREKDAREIKRYALNNIPEMAFNNVKLRNEITTRVKYVFKFIKNYYDSQMFPNETLEHLTALEKRESLILNKIEELLTKEHKDGGLFTKNFIGDDKHDK